MNAQQMGTLSVAVLAVVFLSFALILLQKYGKDVDVWLSQKVVQCCTQRKTRRQEKDAADPGRIERRAKRKESWGKVATGAVLLFGMFLLPIGSIPLAIWQRRVGNEAWALIIVAAMQGALGMWLIVIKTAMEIKEEERQGSANAQDQQSSQ